MGMGTCDPFECFMTLRTDFSSLFFLVVGWRDGVKRNGLVTKSCPLFLETKMSRTFFSFKIPYPPFENSKMVQKLYPGPTVKAISGRHTMQSITSLIVTLRGKCHFLF